MAALADRSPPRKKGRTSAGLSNGNTGIHDLTDGLLVDIFSRFPASSHPPSSLVCRRWISLMSSSFPPSDTGIQDLNDGLLLEIFSRVPATALCRSKLVCWRWIKLIDHPDHRKRLPQPLAGFFFNTICEDRFPISALHFVNVTGRGHPFIYPSFAFLPSHRRLDLLDCCNGLLLCRWYDVSTRFDEFQYVVCNPAREEWVALPDPGQAAGEVATMRLGFDAAMSSHFHVFRLLVDFRRYLTGVDVYSSETGRWIHKEEGWGNNVSLVDPGSATIFLNGQLHFRAVCGDEFCPCVAAVDTKGERWSSFNTPCRLFSGDQFLSFIQKSRGCLHYAILKKNNDLNVQLQVYALECHANKEEWMLKYGVGVEDVIEFNGVSKMYFEWVAIDPECKSIFFIDGSAKTLRRYGMDRQRQQRAKRLLTLGDCQAPYLPYVPMYSELESLHK